MDQLIKPGVTKKKYLINKAKLVKVMNFTGQKSGTILPQGCEVLRRTTKLHQSSELNQANKK